VGQNICEFYLVTSLDDAVLWHSSGLQCSIGRLAFGSLLLSKMASMHNFLLSRAPCKTGVKTDVPAVTSTPDAVPVSKQAEALSLTAGMADQAVACGEGCSSQMLSGRGCRTKGR